MNKYSKTPLAKRSLRKSKKASASFSYEFMRDHLYTLSVSTIL